MVSPHGHLLFAQGNIVCDHCDALGIRRLSLHIADRVAEDALEGLDIPAIPCDLDGVADGTLDAAGRGAVFLGDGGIEHLGDGVDDLHIADGEHDRLAQVLIALDVRGDADLMDDVGDHGLEIRLAGDCRCTLIARRARLRGLPDAADEQLRRAGLGQIIRRAELRRLGEHLLRIEPGDDDGAGAPVLALQPLQHGEAVRLGQDHIRDKHVRILLSHEGERLLPVVRRADERHVALALQQAGDELAEILACIGQKHADFGCHNLFLRKKFRSRDAGCLNSLYHRFFSNNLAWRPCQNKAKQHDLLAEFVDIIRPEASGFDGIFCPFGRIHVAPMRNDRKRQKHYVNKSSTKFDKQRLENPPSD